MNAFANVVNHVNKTMQQFLEQHKNFVPLGPLYAHMDSKLVKTNLVLHRMHKKFAPPVLTIDDERRTSTIKSMIEYDSAGITNFQRVVQSSDPQVKYQLYKARELLHEALRTYRFSVSGLEFPSGETYVSARGDTSLYAKLRDRKQWCVTPDCFNRFAELAYNSPLLKYAARRHFKHFQNETKKKFADKAMYEAARLIDPRKFRFLVFKAKLRCIVTFVGAARITTVPKDLVVDRVIECDAFCNMCVQLTIDAAIKKCVFDHFGVDLLTSQVVHKLLIADDCNATIDFTNASNSTYNDVVNWFLGDHRLNKDLQSSRCGYVELPDGTIHQLNMLSPMGNGFTFSVMTLLLMAVARTVDSFAHVFGDDVIVHNDVAPFLVRVYNTMGYKTNESKTFLSSTFRESCGGFYSNGYLNSFDFHWADDIVDAAVICNKVSILMLTCEDLQLHELHRDLLSAVPPSLLKGYTPPADWSARIIKEVTNAVLSEDRRSHDFCAPLPPLSDGFWCNPKRVTRLQKADVKCKTAFKRQSKTLTLIAGDGKSVPRITPYLRLTRAAETYKFRNGRIMQPVDNVSRLLSWFYVYCGRIQAPTVNKPLLKSAWVFEWAA